MMTEPNQKRKAENLLLAVCTAFLTAVWLAGGKGMKGSVSNAVNASGGLAAIRAWADMLVGIILVSVLSLFSCIVVYGLRQIFEITVEKFAEFKAKRLDWWLESRGRKHVNAEICFVFVLWTIFVGLIVWLRHD